MLYLVLCHVIFNIFWFPSSLFSLLIWKQIQLSLVIVHVSNLLNRIPIIYPINFTAISNDTVIVYVKIPLDTSLIISLRSRLKSKIAERTQNFFSLFFLFPFLFLSFFFYFISIFFFFQDFTAYFKIALKKDFSNLRYYQQGTRVLVPSTPLSTPSICIVFNLNKTSLLLLHIFQNPWQRSPLFFFFSFFFPLSFLTQ